LDGERTELAADHCPLSLRHRCAGGCSLQFNL